MKSTSTQSSVRIFDMHPSATRVAVRATPEFVTVLKSKIKHGESFTAVDSVDQVGSGWFHLNIRAESRVTGQNLTPVDREILALTVAEDLEQLAIELESADDKGPEVSVENRGRGCKVLTLNGKLSSAQRPERPAASKGPSMKTQLQALSNKFDRTRRSLKTAKS